MAENKKSFIAYSDWKDTFDALDDDKAGLLIKHIFSYVNDENPETDDPIVKAVFPNIKNTLKRDLKKWDKQYQQRVEAGKKSAEVRKRNATVVNARTVSSTVSVSVSDSVTNNNTTSHKINFGGLLDFINSTMQRKFKVINKAVISKYNARLKEGYTNKDIQSAIINASKDPFHKENNFKFLTPEYFSRASTLDLHGSKSELTKDRKIDLKKRYV